jgi:hypothetical protein
MKDHEKRTEARIRSKGTVNLIVNGAGPVSGTIYDISVSGLGVQTETNIALGSPVGIDGDGFTAEGVVRYSAIRGGKYRLGVELI